MALAQCGGGGDGGVGVCERNFLFCSQCFFIIIIILHNANE